MKSPSPSADPARSLALLWGNPDKAGRSGLSVRGIVRAAMEIADAQGMEAVSMAAIAKRLEVGTMSLYTHVPSKADLTDLMIDWAHGELYADAAIPNEQPGGWREAMQFVAEKNWELYLRHPWLLEVLGARPVLGPHTTLKYEAELRPLDGQGFSDLEMDSALALVLSHVQASARLQFAMKQTAADSGSSETEWWISHEPILARLSDRSRFPTASRVGEAAGQQYQGATDPAHALRFGLARILDGLESYLARKRE